MATAQAMEKQQEEQVAPAPAPGDSPTAGGLQAAGTRGQAAAAPDAGRLGVGVRGGSGSR